MSENSMWRHVRDGMRGLWTVQRHEDKMSKGIADVSFAIGQVNGWLELKYLPHWPKKADNVVQIPHFTNEQRVWLSERPHAWLFLQVAKDYLLFRGCDVHVVGHVPRRALIDACHWTCVSPLKFHDLAATLASGARAGWIVENDGRQLRVATKRSLIEKGDDVVVLPQVPRKQRVRCKGRRRHI